MIPGDKTEFLSDILPDRMILSTPESKCQYEVGHYTWESKSTPATQTITTPGNRQQHQ